LHWPRKPRFIKVFRQWHHLLRQAPLHSMLKAHQLTLRFCLLLELRPATIQRHLSVKLRMPHSIRGATPRSSKIWVKRSPPRW
jgi:hypothetical protein